MYKPTNFQTPPDVAVYMISMIPAGANRILEPTPGEGNIVHQLINAGYQVTDPIEIFGYLNHHHDSMFPFKFDCIVMNPPFSTKYAFGVPEDFDHHGMRLGYYLLTECMKLSDHVIALMPWFTISDSDVRLRFLKRWGLRSITALPRKTFKYARIQTCVLELDRGYNGETLFKVYDCLPYKPIVNEHNYTTA